MSTLMPEGENLRKAVKWISEKLEADLSGSRIKLIDQAVFTYDLSPLDTEFLIKFFSKKNS